MTLKDIGMTEEMALEEMYLMRAFDSFLRNKFGKEYDALCKEFSREMVEKEMRMADIPEEDIKEVCDSVDKEYDDILEERKKGLN